MIEPIEGAETCVWVKLRFIGFHRWKEAPGQYNFLKDWHRHEFHISAGKKVTELNRQIEFLRLKDQMLAYVREVYEGKRFELSCEMIAHDLIGIFGLSFCSVSEDDENGALVQMRKEKT